VRWRRRSDRKNGGGGSDMERLDRIHVCRRFCPSRSSRTSARRRSLWLPCAPPVATFWSGTGIKHEVWVVDCVQGKKKVGDGDMQGWAGIKLAQTLAPNELPRKVGDSELVGDNTPQSPRILHCQTRPEYARRTGLACAPFLLPSVRPATWQ
jgi:hypothetical protein